MSRLFRWQGLVVFTTIVALLGIFFYIFAETLIKKGIEKSVGWSLGAEVNVEKVTLTYSPINISVDNFQATDAQQPTHNLVNFKKASAGFELWQYFFGKIIINDLSIDGLAFNQKRKAVGEVYLAQVQSEEELAQSENSLLPALDVSLPDTQTLLSDSNLLTVKQAKTLKQSYQIEKNKLKALKADLPNKAKIESYQKRLKALGKIKVKSLDDIVKIKKQFDQIKSEFKVDKKLIKQAKLQLEQTKKLMAKQVSLMKNAPKQDWQNIEKKYQLDQIDAEDFAHILFGNQAREYYQTAEMIYNKIKPYLDKNKTEKDEKLKQIAQQSSTGRFIFFEEEQPLPSFLVKNAQISMQLPQGDFSLVIEELTHQHWLRGKQTQLTFSSSNLNNSGLFTLTSEFSLTQAQALTAGGQWLLENMQVNNVKFRESKKLNLSLVKGIASGAGQFVLENHIISNLNNIKLTKTNYQGKASSHVGNILIDTFKSMKDLAITIKVSGDASDPEYSITSPLASAIVATNNSFCSAVNSAPMTWVKKSLNTCCSVRLELTSATKRRPFDAANCVRSICKILG